MYNPVSIKCNYEVVFINFLRGVKRGSVFHMVNEQVKTATLSRSGTSRWDFNSKAIMS